MHSAELRIGRRLLVVLEPGDDVVAGITAACREHGIERGVVPVFLGAFAEMGLIGTTEPVVDPGEPLARSVTVRWAEGHGAATIAPDPDGEPVVHLHAAVGDKLAGAAAVAGHVLHATAQYTVELVIEEVLAPALVRALPSQGHPVPILTWPEPSSASRP